MRAQPQCLCSILCSAISCAAAQCCSPGETSLRLGGRKTQRRRLELGPELLWRASVNFTKANFSQNLTAHAKGRLCLLKKPPPFRPPPARLHTLRARQISPSVQHHWSRCFQHCCCIPHFTKQCHIIYGEFKASIAQYQILCQQSDNNIGRVFYISLRRTIWSRIKDTENGTDNTETHANHWGWQFNREKDTEKRTDNTET